MLDAETKQRIQNARDVLVGKVPDPKSQVEQITLALMYRFMDSMDRESEALGGTARFFANGYERFAWGKVMDPRLGGRDRQDLYREAIEEMSNNPHLPQLFRDIFRGAYLPYRDEETLRLFLAEINAFGLDHTEDLGDAYEHLLSILSSQGNAGQFRTPRHIIDFIVKVVDPKKGDTVLDPACGTAGFLIYAYQHILNASMDERPGDRLTGDERARLMTQFCGYDISPDMVRLSRVNMYLHGFPAPDIHEYDTLTSEERWDDTFDVILANPPFMTPKGGIRPHRRFGVQANRSEVLFVDYIAEHLNPAGRAGVIVPEGIIFQSSNAYKRLRKMLVEDGFLWAVVSLPAGVFNPYAGVKTSILLLDRAIAKRSDSILFVKVENDGFDLGAQRRPIEANDLPAALEVLRAFRANPAALPQVSAGACHPGAARLIARKRLLESPDCTLSVDRYPTATTTASAFPFVSLGDESLFRVESGGTPSTRVPEYWDGGIPWMTLVDLPPSDIVTSVGSTARTISETGLRCSSATVLPVGAVLVSTRATIGRIGVARVPLCTNQGFKNVVVTAPDRAIPEYVAYALTRLVPTMRAWATGGTFAEISKTRFCEMEIPLPPLEVQQQIVDEIEGYQKVIDGARQVVENWRPWFRIDPAWPTVELGEVCSFKNGINYRSQDGGVPIKIVGVGDFRARLYAPLDELKTASLPSQPDQGLLLEEGDLLFVRSNGNPALVGRSLLISEIGEPVTFSGFTIRARPDRGAAFPLFLALLLRAPGYAATMTGSGRGASIRNVTQDAIARLRVPLPPLVVQQQLAEGIEVERQAVAASRELIAAMEARIAAKLEEVWHSLPVLRCDDAH